MMRLRRRFLSDHVLDLPQPLGREIAHDFEKIHRHQSLCTLDHVGRGMARFVLSEPVADLVECAYAILAGAEGADRARAAGRSAACGGGFSPRFFTTAL